MAEMNPLRRRMIEDMQVRNLSPVTQRCYVHAVGKFARHFNRSPDRLGLEEVRAYQIHLTTTGISWAGFLQLQPVERAGRVADHRGGDLRVASCRRQIAMAEQRLDNPDVGAGFEQMSSKAVAQRMNSDRLVEFGCCSRDATGGL